MKEIELADLGARIRSRRKDLKMSQEELAGMAGYKNRASISRIEKGEVNLRRHQIQKIADILNVSPGWLMGWEDESVFNFPGVQGVTKKRFPLLGSIACGEPIFDEETEAYIEADADIKADFCLRAKGDSMMGARIYDGDIIFIRSQPTVENGEIAAVVIDGALTLKRVRYDTNGISLFPENPKYPVMHYYGPELEQIRILGKAVNGKYGIK